MKTIIVTGGSDGLGKAIAMELKSNYRVVILSPNTDKLKTTSKQLQIDYQQCDVSNYQQCQSAIKAIIDKNQHIDCLINSAGVWIEGALENYQPEKIEQALKINLLGPIFMSQAVIPHMKQQKTGTIININSQAGLYAKPLKTVYNASKWGLTGFSKSLRMELADFNIRVTDVYPAKMNTQLFAKAGMSKDMANAIDPRQMAKMIAYIINLPQEVVVREVGMGHMLG